MLGKVKVMGEEGEVVVEEEVMTVFFRASTKGFSGPDGSLERRRRSKGL